MSDALERQREKRQQKKAVPARDTSLMGQRPIEAEEAPVPSVKALPEKNTELGPRRYIAFSEDIDEEVQKQCGKMGLPVYIEALYELVREAGQLEEAKARADRIKEERKQSAHLQRLRTQLENLGG
ncbi:hypothetical protein C1752_08947 [Acaryochloris thomasi RCC1774]|uniref:Uncharacterized protein n=1 Tax=Acaryochloris thomasi RCC1774 TaxID=1764569 RepID=A0A2W1JGQ4_9CYAN|nr:hypothetical protein [Acaryochloris thomasi]PZD70805.1 hypothetical protein C1752_08947 [Acaryochloris thomasi RCC1774]